MAENLGYELQLSIAEALKALDQIPKYASKILGQVEKETSEKIANAVNKGFSGGKSGGKSTTIKLDADDRQLKSKLKSLENAMIGLRATTNVDLFGPFRKQFDELIREIGGRSNFLKNSPLFGSTGVGDVAVLQERVKLMRQAFQLQSQVAAQQERYSAALRQQQSGAGAGAPSERSNVANIGRFEAVSQALERLKSRFPAVAAEVEKLQASMQKLDSTKFTVNQASGFRQQAKDLQDAAKAGESYEKAVQRAKDAVDNLTKNLQARKGFDGSSPLFSGQDDAAVAAAAKRAADKIDKIRRDSANTGIAEAKRQTDRILAEYRRETQGLLTQQLVKDQDRAKASGRQSLAFSQLFQVQQAFEDFAVAGVRGAGNNIALLLSQMGTLGAVGLGAITAITAGWIAYNYILGESNDSLDEQLEKLDRIRDRRLTDQSERATPKFVDAEGLEKIRSEVQEAQSLAKARSDELVMLQRIQRLRQDARDQDTFAKFNPFTQEENYAKARELRAEATKLEETLRKVGVVGIGDGILDFFVEGNLGKAIEKTGKELEKVEDAARKAEDALTRALDPRVQVAGLAKNAAKELTGELEKQRDILQDIISKEVQRLDTIRRSKQESQFQFQDAQAQGQLGVRNNTIDRQAQEVIERERVAVQRYIRQKYGTFEGINPFWEQLRQREEQAAQQYLQFFERSVGRAAEREKAAAQERFVALNRRNLAQRADNALGGANEAAQNGQYAQANRLLDDRIKILTQLRDLQLQQASTRQTAFDKRGEQFANEQLKAAEGTQKLIDDAFSLQEKLSAKAQGQALADLAQINTSLTEVKGIKTEISNLNMINPADLERAKELIGILRGVKQAKDAIGRGQDIAAQPGAIPPAFPKPDPIGDAARERGIGLPNAGPIQAPPAIPELDKAANDARKRADALAKTAEAEAEGQKRAAQALKDRRKAINEKKAAIAGGRLVPDGQGGVAPRDMGIDGLGPEEEIIGDDRGRNEDTGKTPRQLKEERAARYNKFNQEYPVQSPFDDDAPKFENPNERLKAHNEWSAKKAKAFEAEEAKRKAELESRDPLNNRPRNPQVEALREDERKAQEARRKEIFDRNQKFANRERNPEVAKLQDAGQEAKTLEAAQEARDARGKKRLSLLDQTKQDIARKEAAAAKEKADGEARADEAAKQRQKARADENKRLKDLGLFDPNAARAKAPATTLAEDREIERKAREAGKGTTAGDRFDALKYREELQRKRDGSDNNAGGSLSKLRDRLKGGDQGVLDNAALQKQAEEAARAAQEKARAGATSMSTPGDVEALNAAAAAAERVAQAKAAAAAIPLAGGGLPNVPIASPGTPGRASGGPVLGGGSYMVGERGPEMFTPRGSGNITNATRTAGALSSAGSYGTTAGFSTSVTSDNSTSVGSVTVNNFGAGTSGPDLMRAIKQRQKSQRIFRGRV